MLKFSVLPHLYRDIRLLSVQLLAAEVQSPAFTLHYTTLLGQRREVNLKQITHFRVCFCNNWVTQNYELYGEAIFVCCIVCINLFIA